MIRALFVAPLVGVFSVHAAALGGPLDPPAGPIASTAKPLAEVEPRIAINATNTPGDADSHFKITQAGSYYLTGNISLPSVEKAIEIVIGSGQQVTIDLNGFTISASDAARSLPAISIDGADAHVAIRNGSIRNWSNAILHPVGGSITLEDVKAYGSRLNQFELREATVTRCLAEDGGVHGFFVNGAATFTDCLARANGADGFTIGSGTIIAHRCASLGNGEEGFLMGQGIAESCRAENNNGAGFVGAGLVANCTALSNGGDGIQCSAASNVRGCTVIANGGDGIQVSSVARVEGNTVTSNGDHGVNITGSRTVVVGNLIGTNGRDSGVFAGVVCSSSDCVIDSNQITSMTVGGDDFGIQVTGTSNLIVRNQISNVSTSLSIAAGNTSGGTSATPNTAGAWVNLTY